MLASLANVTGLPAVRAARALLADPDDLPQVFTLIEELSGDTLARIEKRLSSTETGRALLEERPDIVPVLTDRAALERLPVGSLGRAYLAFMESEAISAGGIQEAEARGKTGGKVLPAAEEYVGQRLRDTHDLWHAVTGYKGDVLGETALLAFTLAQTWNPALFVIASIGLFKMSGAREARELIVRGFRRGLRASWFPGERWESLLALPLDEVRHRLLVDDPPVYTPVRTAEIRAERAA